MIIWIFNVSRAVKIKKQEIFNTQVYFIGSDLDEQC